VFTQFPASAHDGLIVRYPDRDDGRLGYCFADAANRLANSYEGAPDDALLLPFLHLYRHAIELDLKYAIRYAARLRRNNGETGPELDATAVAERLQRKHGHRLMALVDELDKQLAALELPPVPADVRRTLELVSATDPKGESFRYPDALPAAQDNINFYALAEAVRGAYEVTSAASSMLSQLEDAQQEVLAMQRVRGGLPGRTQCHQGRE
jgi:hypothetical protein